MSRSRKHDKASKSPTPVPAPESTIPEGGGPRRGLLRFAQAAYVAALGISLYLAHTSLTNGAVAGCGAGSNCNAVLSSRWAYWFSLPVSVPAAAFYVALIVTSLLTGSGRSPQTQARAWTCLIAGAFAVLGAALWFVGLQAVIIGRWCPYCMTAHALGAAASVLVLFAAPFVIRGPVGNEPMLFGVNRRMTPAVLGILALMPLVFGQYLSHPPSGTLATLATENPSVQPSATNAGATSATNPPTSVAANRLSPKKPSRMFSLHNGRFSFDLYQVPLIGQPEAPHVVVNLFDYSCIHCRREHFILKRIQAVFSNQLAIVLLPMPLDQKCNPLLKATAPDHVNACEYAHIGMAVWRAKREVYPAYEEWFFATERPRPVAEVEAKAVELTGRKEFDAAMADPWIDQWLKMGREVFKANWDLSGRSYLPMLNVGQVLSSGELKSDDEFYDMLEKYEGLKRPSNLTNSPAK